MGNSQAPVDAAPFVDTPLKQAMRAAFDDPTIAKIEAVAAESSAALLARVRELEDDPRLKVVSCGWDYNGLYQHYHDEKGRADTAEATVRELEQARDEICICAAIRCIREGRIVRGHRHDNCIQAAANMHIDPHGCEQGFITSRNRFVSREEGARLQRAAGIVSAQTGQFADLLFSEDLYLKHSDPAALEARGAAGGRQETYATPEKSETR